MCNLCYIYVWLNSFCRERPHAATNTGSCWANWRYAHQTATVSSTHTVGLAVFTLPLVPIPPLQVEERLHPPPPPPRQSVTWVAILTLRSPVIKWRSSPIKIKMSKVCKTLSALTFHNVLSSCSCEGVCRVDERFRWVRQSCIRFMMYLVYQ